MEEQSDGEKRPREKRRVRDDNASSADPPQSPKAHLILLLLFVLTFLSVTDATAPPVGPTPTPIGNGGAAAVHRDRDSGGGGDVVATSQLIVASLSTPPASSASSASSQPEIASFSGAEKLSQGKRDRRGEVPVCLSKNLLGWVSGSEKNARLKFEFLMLTIPQTCTTKRNITW